jgi:hypothetical protein
MTRPTPAHTLPHEVVIAGRAAAAAAAVRRAGQAEPTARAWIETLHARAQRRAERYQRARRRRVTALAATAVMLAASALIELPRASAAQTTVSPGDRLETPGASCTIGYAYTGTDEHTYAITAGHCASDIGRRVRDSSSSAAGILVRDLVDPPHSGGADYALIDFGPRAIPLPFIGDLPTAFGHPRPQPGQTICRTGVSSGQHCGTVAKIYGDHQYLTSGMPESVPGDSGGPVWIPRDRGPAQIVGIWLGGTNTAAGNSYGRFASLAGGLDSLGLD